MSVVCPNCRSSLNVKGLKPGQFKPKCPKCGVVFALLVPDSPDGTPLAKLLPEKAVSTEAADPNATGAFTEVDRGEPDRTNAYSPSVVQEPESTGEFTEVNREVDRTGVFAPSGVEDDGLGGTSRFEPSEPPTRVETEKKPAAKEKFPDRLGGYEVLKVLGKGGMGSVLLGRQLSLDRKVALKVMHPNVARNPGFVARFSREAYAAAQLNHHNVVQIYDIGEDRGTHFFSMEFVAGQSLMDLIKEKGKLDVEVAVGYALQAARGLRYGHTQGMVHRDVKPDNLMLNTDGIVKVADLGLVKLPAADIPQPSGSTDIDDELEAELESGQTTRAGVVMGTPSYMPPEQAVDSSSVDQRADIYSLGCSLYVMVTGKPPFEGKTAMEVMTKHRTDPVVPPDVIVKRVPKALSTILLKMLAKNPNDRYQNMDEVIAALEGYLGVLQAGPFTPKEEHAQRLESAAQKFNAASKRGVRKLLGLGFLAVCLLGIVGCGLAGAYSWAGGFLGLLITAPIAYFIIHGIYSKSVVFTKVRQLLFGSRIVDWLLWSAGMLLFLLSLWIFGILWHFLGFAILGVGLAFVLWFLTDRVQDAAREEPIDDAKLLFKSMRLQGLDEEHLRQFVCKYAGDRWEEFYESLFGYEAKIAARAYRRGSIAETAETFAAWREPVIAGIEHRMRLRQEARERRYLERVQAQALEAKGVSAHEAKERAAALADVLVDQANEVKAAVKAGTKVDLRALVKAARSKKPPEGYNIAGIKRRNLAMTNFLNDWCGRRLRFLVGAAVLAVGLLWLNQNRDVIKGLSAVAEKAVEKGTLDAAGAAGQTVQKAAGTMKPLRLAIVPANVAMGISHFGTPLCGFCLMLTGLFYYGWKPSLVAIPGVVIGSMGPMLGTPDVEPIKAWMLSAAIGLLLIIVAARFLRS